MDKISKLYLIEESLEKVIYTLHTLPVKLTSDVLKISRYDSSRMISWLGIGASNAYLISTILNSTSASGDALNIILAGAIDLGYLYFYRSNIRRADMAKTREEYLCRQGLDVMIYEENLQRRYMVPAAKWYLLSEMLIPLLYGFSSSATSPVSVVSLMFATSCIYGARYALLAR